MFNKATYLLKIRDINWISAMYPDCAQAYCFDIHCVYVLTLYSNRTIFMRQWSKLKLTP